MHHEPSYRNDSTRLWRVLLAASLVGWGCSPSIPSELVTDASGTGPEDAPVVIVEFGDYGCSPCASFGRRLHQVIGERRGRVRFVYRHCPSRRRPIGGRAARMAVAAELQGRFWELHWRLIAAGPIVDEEQLDALVIEAGMDPEALRTLADTSRVRQLIERDLALADRLGLRGTPTTYIGPTRFEGSLSTERLRLEIDRLLSARHRPTGTARCARAHRVWRQGEKQGLTHSESDGHTGRPRL